MANKVVNAEVVARPNEHAERLIRRFVKKCKRSGILDEVRSRRYHEKNSDKKRRKKAEAEYRRLRDERKRQKLEQRNRKMRK